MSRHRFDVSEDYLYKNRQDLPDSRKVEDPDAGEQGFPQKDEYAVKEVPREPYRPGPKLIEAVNLAIASGRPLLLQGDPGCGKTRLAYTVAYELGLPLEECYIKSTSRAQDLLYTYDAVNRLYDAQLGAEGPKESDGATPRCQNVRNYIRLGPLGRAILRTQSGRRSVVLIDEIDKADLDFPNDLLLELDRLQFQVAEVPEMRYEVSEGRLDLRPIVFVTHNEEKALPTAFLRRCIFHYVEFPEKESELLEILQTHAMQDKDLNNAAVAVIKNLRHSEYAKKPGLSELLDWVGYMQHVEGPPKAGWRTRLQQLPYIGFLLKQHADQSRAKQEFDEKK